MATVDPILDRLHEQFPEVVPHYGRPHEQYLLSWEPVIADPDGTRRGMLKALRREIREELGIGTGEDGTDWRRAIWSEHLWFLYERELFDAVNRQFRVEALIDRAEADFGGYEAVCLWQSYPRLGPDRRNQFDYYRDLPGGLRELGRIVASLHARGVRAFLTYNPWDTGTRREPEGDAETLAALLGETGADGVFLDTLASVDPAFGERLRRARADVALCPELLPPLAEVTSHTGGWQQFAVPTGRELLAHRWIDPSYCLRFVDRSARSRREEIAAAFLHGSGHVVWENVFGWWNPWNGEDRLMLKRTTAILRTYARFFRDPLWEPFVATGRSGVYANEWHCGRELLVTLYNSTPKPCDSVRLALPEGAPERLVDLWTGRELGRWRHGGTIGVELKPGEVGCLIASDTARVLELPAEAGDDRRHRPLALAAYLPRPLPTPPARLSRSARRDLLEREMVRIPQQRYTMRVRRACDPAVEGGSYADISRVNAQAVPDQYFWLDAYCIDRTPVTNADFERFLRASRYLPREGSRFLDHWRKPPGSGDSPWRWGPPDERRDHPVVWVSIEDARAYAEWAGLRLPSEAEWQLAAEGDPPALWPWGDQEDRSRCNGDSGETSGVYAQPEGASRAGCLEMSGNVWEWTESERDDGHTRYVMVRGGCHLRVSGSIWYTASGAQPCDVHEKLLLLGGGIDRLATVGFRCVRPERATGRG